jgi:hypothetical protein
MGNPLGREAIYSAFFSQLQTALMAPTGPFNYSGRRPISDAALVGALYPAFIFTETGEVYDRTVLFAPARVTLLANIQISTICGDIRDDSSVTSLNNLADLVEAAIQSYCQPTAQNILGGLVQEAWLNHRQVVLIAQTTGNLSKFNMGIEIVLPHSR